MCCVRIQHTFAKVYHVSNLSGMRLVSLLRKVVIVSLLALFVCVFSSYAQTQPCAITGVVKDSATGKPIESVAVSLVKLKVGTLTDEDGEFRIVNNKCNNAKLIFTAMGYKTKEIVVSPGKYYQLNVKLVSEGVQIKEIVVTKIAKEKYSKKNNPAVELIKHVIANKNRNFIDDQDYYKCSQYERIFFAINDFRPGHGILKSQKYLAKYTDTSRIDGRIILPYTVREYSKDFYYRKSPKTTKEIILGYNQQGVDKKMDNSSFTSATDETFKNINIRDNQIDLFMIGFVSPLSSSSAVNFYKWYIRDTVDIDNQKYIQLGFLPFNTRDVGFSGDLFVKADTSYAVRKVVLRIPKKANINFVKTMLVEQEFKEVKPNIWAPYVYRTMVDFELKHIGKVYVQKDQSYKDYVTGGNYALAFETPDKVVKVNNYDERDKQFWKESRPSGVAKDLRLDSMMEEANKSQMVRIGLRVADFIQSGYIHTVFDPKVNKLDIGSAQTFYSSNKVEGSRFRLSTLTTANFNPQLFFYGYAAYGTKDHRLKYDGELTWALTKRTLVRDEFPRNNLSFIYKYDINTLGQQFLQATPDNFLQSFKIHDVDNMTYKRTMELNYIHESQKNFRTTLFVRNNIQEPAGDLQFNYADNSGVLPKLRTTEAGIFLRYGHNEKFVQMKRDRILIPSQYTIVSFENTWGLKNVLNSDYSYHSMALELDKSKWFAPYGQLYFSARAEKIWGTVPYPLLLMPNADNSYVLLRGTFNLVTPLEFINDRQVSWMLDYHLGGWLLNRIPFIKTFKWREVFGFHGLWGDLSDKNNPSF